MPLVVKNQGVSAEDRDIVFRNADPVALGGEEGIELGARNEGSVVINGIFVGRETIERLHGRLGQWLANYPAPVLENSAAGDID